jgi:hypothetical protein
MLIGITQQYAKEVAMPIPSGEWTLVDPNDSTRVTFTFSEYTGSLSGTFDNKPFVGFFNETSQTLKIWVDPHVVDSTNVIGNPLLIYEGSLFQFTPTHPGTQSVVSVLTGVHYSNPGIGLAQYVHWLALNHQP